MIYFLGFILFIGLTYWIGSYREKAHYKSIQHREKVFNYLQVSTIQPFSPSTIASTDFIISEAVVAEDFFKRFWAVLRDLFGGPITAYETLLDRARREATIRLKEQAPLADGIVNLRYATNNISPRMAEIIVYGTVVYLKDNKNRPKK